MRKRFYYKSRFLKIIISVIFFLLFIYLSENQWTGILISSVIGVSSGFLSGVISWNNIKRRTDKRNVVILYETDSIFYVVLILLFLIQYNPKSLLTVLKFSNSSIPIIELLLITILALWVGYNITLWRLIRTFEFSNGRLITKHFWSRSKVGQEGMISKNGIVIEACNPSGKVRIGSEIWNAESIDGLNIRLDRKIVVRDIEGMTLIVEEVK